MRGFSAIVGLVLLAAATAQAAEGGSLLRIASTSFGLKPGHPYRGGTLPAVLPQEAAFDPLVKLDKTGKPSPALAVSWSSTDSKVWTFKLRPGVKFSNGEPFTAEALVVSHEHLSSDIGQTETVGSYLTNIARVRVVDDLTAEITLSEVDVIFPIHASVWFIAAPAAWKKMGPDEFSAHPVGTGPFIITGFQTAKADMVRNPNAWQPPKVDRVQLLIVKDEAARESALLAGQIDVAMSISAESKERMEGAGAAFVVRPTPLINYSAFNLVSRPNSPLNDKRVRQAINYAVDREAIVKSLLLGASYTTGQLAAPTSFGFNPKIKPYPYDPARAKALLKEAGFANGFELTIELAVLGSSDSLLYQRIAEDLSKVGIRATIRQVTLSQLTIDMFTGTMPADLFQTGIRSLDPLLDYRFRMCLKPSPGRKAFACNQSVLEVAARAKAQSNLAAAEALYRETLQREYDDPPGLFLWEKVDFDAVSAKVVNYAPVLDFVNFDTIDLKP